MAERALKTIIDHYDEKMVLKKWTHEEIIAMIKKHGEPTDLIVLCTRNLCDAYHFEKADWERVYGAKKELCAKVSGSVVFDGVGDLFGCACAVVCMRLRTQPDSPTNQPTKPPGAGRVRDGLRARHGLLRGHGGGRRPLQGRVLPCLRHAHAPAQDAPAPQGQSRLGIDWRRPACLRAVGGGVALIRSSSPHPVTRQTPKTNSATASTACWAPTTAARRR